ncbi:hypothetical protein ACA910_006710 [Epithemia clementina (nom. ined.)]
MLFHPVVIFCSLSMVTNAPSFDRRKTLSREKARQVYDKYADDAALVAGNDVASGYGGPAVKALLEMADFDSAKQVLEYGTGQGKLAELVLSSQELSAQ